jgi:hypothetical protein
MNAEHDSTEALFDEIARYLAAVDAFRAEACEPTWLPEPVFSRVDPNMARAGRDTARAAH